MEHEAALQATVLVETGGRLAPGVLVGSADAPVVLTSASGAFRRGRRHLGAASARL